MSVKAAQYKLKRSALAASSLLVLIYLLGVYTALFVSIPETARWASMMKSMVLLAHATLGTLLIFHAASILMMARKAKSALWTRVALIGLAGIVLSVATGSSFVGADSDLMSFLMATGFAVSILAYVYGIYADQT